MFRSRVPVASLVWLVAGGVAPIMAADPPTPEALVRVIQSADSSPHDKALACEELGAFGTADAVPALASLLDDPNFSHYARYALQNIPGVDSGKALRSALTRLNGDRLVGAINSVGARQDSQAAELLALLASSSDSDVAVAAAAALARIDAGRFKAMLTRLPSGSRGRLADATLACAERLAVQGDGESAVAMLKRIDLGGATSAVRSAVVLGVVRYSDEDTASSFVEDLLASNEGWRFTAGLQAAVQGEIPRGAALLAGAVRSDQPVRHAQLVHALGVIGDRSAIGVARAAAGSSVAEVRAEGIRAIGALGDAADAPLLMRLALAGDAAGEAARQSLVSIKDPKLDDSLTAMLRESDSDSRVLAAELLGRRRVTAAATALVEVARTAGDPAVRAAALEAARRVAVGETLPELLDLAAGADSPSERKLAEQASLAAASRLADRDSAANLVADRLRNAPGGHEGILLNVLAAIGGPRSLEVVAATAHEPDRVRQDQATRVLGAWRTPDAAPVLLELASSSHLYSVRALRGYLRIARQLEASESERLRMCREALAVAARTEERLLVLQILERQPSVEGLALASQQLNADRLGEQASGPVVQIAEAIAPSHPSEAAAAAKLVLEAGGSDETLGLASKLATD